MDVEEARTMVLQLAQPLEVESAALCESLGRRLATDLVATHPHPRADNSAMDGYAVRCADLMDASASQPVFLARVGASEAGRPFEGTLEPGQTVRILTGGLVPDGADAVVMQEAVRLADQGQRVGFTQPPPPGNDIRRAGEEWQTGDRLLPAGTRLGPAALGLLAAAGQDSARVHRRPRVALAVTGDELNAGAASGPARIHDANTPMLAAWLSEQGAEVVSTDGLPDDLDAVTAWLTAAAARADVVVTAGGASVGDRDFLGPAWDQAGYTTAFWGVAMKPGKPVRFGHVDLPPGRRVLACALPGNPLSALAGAEQFLAPCLTVLSGGAWCPPARLRLPLAKPWSANRGRRYLLRAVAQGEPLALCLSPRQGSAILREAANQALVAHLDGRPREAGCLVEATADPEALRGLVLQPVPPMPLIFGVRGYAKVGKTRLVELLIPRLQEAGLRVGTVKHSHHARQVDQAGTDSCRHAQAGAEQVVLVGPDSTSLIAYRPDDGSLWPWLETFAGRVDVVLVEGFKDRLLPHVSIETQAASAFGLVRVPGELPAWRLTRPVDAGDESLFPDGLVATLAAALIELHGAL